MNVPLINLSKLELRELLRCVERTDCEPEVIDKLRAEIGGAAGYTPSTDKANGLTVIAPPPRMAAITAVVDGPGPQYMTEYEIAAMRALCASREPPQEFSDAEVATVNEERRVTWEAQRKMQDRTLSATSGIAYTNHESQRPQHHEGHPLDRTPLGQTNRFGEKCIGIDANSGCSIFQCKEGHAYVANNPFVVGCTECAVAGNAPPGGGEAVAAGAVREDRGAIEGSDSNW
jgi:hypothetical protein